MLLKNYFTKKLQFSCLLWLISLCTFAQINVSFPTNRIVFQRNNDNLGFVNILGTYSQALDRVDARLTPIVAGQGVATDWNLVQENPKAGYFAGKILGQGGWYKLEIRGIKNGAILKIVTIEKVGIGEVFVMAGQSNAQGLPESGALPATDDRVNVVNAFNSDFSNAIPETLDFVQLSQNVDISPHGTGPWCYGELGDRLVKRLNVPIAFFNAGYLLVSVINWRESAEGKPTFNTVLDVGGPFQYPEGKPYSNLKQTLNYYGSLMGVRSLLWIQGETDNSPNHLSVDAYSANLQRLIDISRNDFDANLTWMVARTSLTYMAPSNPEIIGGQNKVIAKVGNNVFAGPPTDALQVPRADAVHFKNIPPNNMGLSLLAENWDKFIDNNFFQNSRPILAKSIVEPEISCDGNNKSVLYLPNIFKNYDWSNGSKSNQINVDAGIYSVALKDFQGNKLLSPSINTNLIYPQTRPTITNDKNLGFCADGITKVELSANGAEFNSFLWSSGEITQKISTDKTGDFTVKGKNIFGCVSAASDKVSIKASPTPTQPKIIVLPATNVCEGQTIILSANSGGKLLWSNNVTTQAIIIDKVGNYEFSVKTTNEFGCVSPVSEKISVNISKNPAPPKIMVSPATNVCEGQNLTLSTDTNEKLLWSNAATTQSIQLDKVGVYEFSVKATNQFGCVSPVSEKISVNINKNPAPPKITVSPTTNACEGQNLTLSTDTNEKLLWSNAATSQTIMLDKVGNYEFSVKTINQFGCVSPVSSLQKVSIIPIPKQPSIVLLGLYSLQAQNGDFIANDKFEWKKDNTVLLTNTTPTLKISQVGNYAVSTIRSFQTPDNQILTCQSKISESLLIQVFNNNFSLYPNPSTDIIYLETKETIKNVEVIFFTLLGQQVYKFSLENTSERREIDVRNFEKGIYIVKIKGDNFEESARVIIQSK